MPLMLARTLSRKDTPSSVRTLSFDESPGLAPSAHIPADVVLPKVDTVQCYDGVLSFERASFPNLRSVAIELGPRSKMPEVLASYTKLGFVQRLFSAPLVMLSVSTPAARPPRARWCPSSCPDSQPRPPLAGLRDGGTVLA